MGTEGLQTGQVKKWVTRILGKKELVGKDQEARPLEPRGRKAGRRGSCALGGWRTGGVEGGGEP